MSFSEPLLYAEFLPHIRQVSVIAALHSPCDATTEAKLSTDGQQLFLDHAGVTKSLKLPSQTTYKVLPKPPSGSTELSWRLPVAGPPTRVDSDTQVDEGPWSAKRLTKEDEFLCRHCSAIIIKYGTIMIWKDMPSEGWAEMMDLWFCHKPTENSEGDGLLSRRADKAGEPSLGSPHGDVNKSAVNKGYGASTSFSPQESFGFVDTTTLLLTKKDCNNIAVSPFLCLFLLQCVSESSGYQEGGLPSVSLLDGSVTDTNTQDRSSYDSASATIEPEYPFSTIMGSLLDRSSYLGFSFHIFRGLGRLWD